MLTWIRKTRRGANAIEFALTFPVFLAMSFGMMEFGWYFSRVAQVNSASLDGCRAGGLVDENFGNPITEATFQAGQALGTQGLSCDPCTATFDGVIPDKGLVCTVRIDHQGVSGLLPFLPSEITKTTRVRLEWQR